MLSNYDESFQAINNAKIANNNLLDLCIKRLRTFTGSMTQLYDQFSKISPDLPKEKRSKFNIIRGKSDVVVEEPHLSITWEHFSQLLKNLQPGAHEFYDFIHGKFANDLDEIRERYNRNIFEVEKQVKKARDGIKEKTTEYKNADQEYRVLCIKLEESKRIINSLPDNDPSRKSKQDEINIMINTFQSIQSASLKALEALNDQQVSYTVTMESALSAYEAAELQRESAFNELLVSLREPILKFLEAQNNVDEALLGEATSIKSSADLNDYILMSKKNEIKTSPNIESCSPPLPFSIFDKVNPHTIFENDLKTSIATLIQDSDPFYGLSLKSGEVVVVLPNEDPTNTYTYKVYSEDKEISGPINISCLGPLIKKKLYMVTKQHVANVVQELSAESGDFVIGYPKNDQEIFCTNAYRQKGVIPIEKLKIME